MTETELDVAETMGDDKDVHSPEWWLRKLHVSMQSRSQNVKRLRAYYDGEHRLAFASKKFHQQFGGLFDAFSDNWCATVVDAIEERLTVTGFRAGEDVDADDAASEIWQRNGLDLEQIIAHREAAVSGVSFGTAWWGDDGKALVTVEPSDTAEIAVDPRNRRKRVAGLRVWLDDWGYLHAELFLPDGLVQFVSKSKPAAGIIDARSMRWNRDTHSRNGDVLPDTDEDGVRPNPLGVVPMVQFVNNPRAWTKKQGHALGSELVTVIPIQDAINKLISDIMVSSEAFAMPMRYATGYEMTFDQKTKQPIPPAFTLPDATWAVLQEEQAKVGSLPAGDITRIVKAVEMFVQHIASQTRTPAHYLSSSADRLSGESIKSSESGLIAKGYRRQTFFEDPWEELMRISGEIDEIERLAKANSTQAIWKDLETRTEGEVVDAALKRQTLGVPDQQIFEDIGYTPEQIKRFPAMRAQDALRRRVAEQTEPDIDPDPNDDAD